jgi:hypothetical protein
VLEQIRDYPYANGCQVFDDMRELPGKRFAMPAGAPDLPLMCGFVAPKTPDRITKADAGRTRPVDRTRPASVMLR